MTTLSASLQSNTHLRVIDLEDNALTEKGKEGMFFLSFLGLNRSDVLALMTGTNVNLNTVSGANHTCRIDGISTENVFMNRRDESAKSNRRRKLFELLVNRHLSGRIISQLESEFSEDAMGLVPHALACIYPKDIVYQFFSNLHEIGKRQRSISSTETTS